MDREEYARVIQDLLSRDQARVNQANLELYRALVARDATEHEAGLLLAEVAMGVYGGQ